MKYILFLLIAFFSSCISTKNTEKSVVGRFTYLTNKLNYNFRYYLVLNPNGSFSIEIGYQKCSGTWLVKSNNQILLTCNDEENVIEAFSSSYYSSRKTTINIIDNSKLEMIIYEPHSLVLPESYWKIKEKIMLERVNDA